jgi:hypothetical protein
MQLLDAELTNGLEYLIVRLVRAGEGDLAKQALLDQRAHPIEWREIVGQVSRYRLGGSKIES